MARLLSLGDGGYAVKDHLLPSLSNPIDEDKRRYNEIQNSQEILQNGTSEYESVVFRCLALESAQAVILQMAV